MANVTYLGLDVHKDSIAVAVLRPHDREPDQFVVPNTAEALRKVVARFPEATELRAGQ